MKIEAESLKHQWNVPTSDFLKKMWLFTSGKKLLIIQRKGLQIAMTNFDARY